jgi:hypothetical protein
MLKYLVKQKAGANTFGHKMRFHLLGETSVLIAFRFDADVMRLEPKLL